LGAGLHSRASFLEEISMEALLLPGLVIGYIIWILWLKEWLGMDDDEAP